jgi:hypothetical protein
MGVRPVPLRLRRDDGRELLQMVRVGALTFFVGFGIDNAERLRRVGSGQQQGLEFWGTSFNCASHAVDLPYPPPIESIPFISGWHSKTSPHVFKESEALSRGGPFFLLPLRPHLINTQKSKARLGVRVSSDSEHSHAYNESSIFIIPLRSVTIVIIAIIHRWQRTCQRVVASCQ